MNQEGMATIMEDLSYNTVKQRALTALQSSQGSAPASTPTDSTNTLGNLSKNLLDRGVGDRTIMDLYDQRKTLATQTAESNKSLINATYNPMIEQQKITNQNELDANRMAVAGPAVNNAVMRDLENTAAKRIRDLTATRDSLLMQNSINSASQIDNLIAKEQEQVTTARQNYYANLLGLTSAQNTSALIPSQIQSAQAGAAASLAGANLSNVTADQGRVLLNFLTGGQNAGTTAPGSTGPTSSGALDLSTDADDLANGRVAPATIQARYLALGPLGAIMYAKVVADAKRKNPNFSESAANLSYEGQKTQTQNLVSGNPITSIWANFQKAATTPSGNEGSLFDAFNLSKGVKSGKTSSGVGYTIINTSNKK